MLRESFIRRSEASVHKRHDFKWRSREVSRLEGLSDTVFGFAITLLIVSLEVPRTSGELLETMRGFLAFVLTFGVLYSLWHKQFLFFRRYGLEDTTTVVLNGALLLFVLFFVFPFKFLANAIINRAIGLGRYVHFADGRTELAIKPEHLPLLFAIYGLGLACVFLVLGLLYRHALSKSAELELNPVELYDTRETMRLYLSNAALAVLVGLNGLVTGFKSDTTSESVLTIGFVVLEMVAVVFLFRFRATRKSRRSSFIAALTGAARVEQVPIHAH